MRRVENCLLHVCISEMNNFIMNECILTYEVGFAIKRSELNKAVGMDGMPNKMLKKSFSIHFILNADNDFSMVSQKDNS